MKNTRTANTNKKQNYTFLKHSQFNEKGGDVRKKARKNKQAQRWEAWEA